MNDSIYDKLGQITAREVAESLESQQPLPEIKHQAADANADGRIDTHDVELLAKAQLALANKISGAIVGMEPLSDEEKRAAERNGDGFVNLTDAHRLADDAREARRTAGRINRAKTGELPPTP
jgi:hypothetical protein